MAPKISVVVSVYNEEENIKPQIELISQALQDIDHEIIYVDDGSTDGTIQELKSVHNPHLKTIELKKNYGQSLALMAGIDYAQGTFIATMDGDLQNDPSDIPRLLHLIETEDWDMVAGNRANRKDGIFLRKIPSKIANYIIRNAAGVQIKDYGCALRVMKNDLAKDLGLYGELHRFYSCACIIGRCKNNSG